MKIKRINIGTYQKENDHLIVDLDKELPNLTDVRINGIWYEKSLLRNDEHTRAFYRKREREEYRRLRDLEQLCITLFERYDPWDWQTNDGVISYDEAYDRMADLGLLEDCRN